MDSERRMRAMLQEQRLRERASVPSFESVLRGGELRPRRVRPAPLLLALTAAGALLLMLIRTRAGALDAPLDMARQVMTWQAATDVLLPPTVSGLRVSELRLGASPNDSPLRVLDQGGALGPPATPRRPGS